MNRQLIHKIEVDTDRVEAKISKAKAEAKRRVGSWKFKVASVFIGVGIAVALLFYCFYVISSWYAEHKVIFKKPVIVTFQPLVTIEKIILNPVVAKKEPTEAELVAADKIRKEKDREAFIERIYQATRFLETRVGFDAKDSTATHIYCQSIGMINEVGYFPEGNRKFCFKDEAEQKLTLTRWFSKRLDGMTAQEALCLYVTGIRQPMCKRVMDLGL